MSMTDDDNIGGDLSASNDISRGTVRVGKHTYAVGLIWETFDPSIKFAAQAKASAQRLEADLYCGRKNFHQYGIASKEWGHKKGMPSLAATLASTLETPWVGAFEVDGGYYIVATRDDQILATGDRFYSELDEAQSQFYDLVNLASWQKIYAPQNWGVDESVEGSIEDALDGVRPTGKLAPLSNKGSIFAIGLAMVILIGAAVGYMIHQDFLNEQEAERLRQQLAGQVTGKKAPPPPPPMPWEGKPRGIENYTTCIDAILSANIDVAGWKPVELSCDQKSVTMTLERNGGTINWVSPSLATGNFKPRVTLKGDDALVSWNIGAIPMHPKEIRTAKGAEIKRYLVSQFEEIFGSVTVKETEETSYYFGMAFSFKTSHDPKEYVKILEQIPAMILSKVELDLESWTWKIEGNTYEQKPPPPPGQRVSQ